MTNQKRTILAAAFIAGLAIGLAGGGGETWNTGSIEMTMTRVE